MSLRLATEEDYVKLTSVNELVKGKYYRIYDILEGSFIDGYKYCGQSIHGEYVFDDERCHALPCVQQESLLIVFEPDIIKNLITSGEITHYLIRD